LFSVFSTRNALNRRERFMSDFFDAPHMRGLDWPAMRDKYAALLPSKPDLLPC
jgi:hypothetical protein